MEILAKREAKISAVREERFFDSTSRVDYTKQSMNANEPIGRR